MYFSTAPSLLIGLGARILLDKFTRSEEPSFTDSLVIGVWQGVGIYYAFANSLELAFGVAFVVAAMIFIDFTSTQDTTKSTCTLFGVALGVLCTEVLSQCLDPHKHTDKTRNRSNHGPTHQSKQRSVQFRQGTGGEAVQHPRERAFRQTLSDITSVDSSSMLIPKATMSPMEREVAALRARASLADSERRRYKEEKKWALEQGNPARASQMAWQVKRYTALMQSFHREADARIVEATNERVRQTAKEEQKHIASQDRYARNSSRDVVIEGPSTINVDIGHQRKRSGPQKSALRVQVRS